MPSPKTGTILVYVLLTIGGVVIAPLAILALSKVDLTPDPPKFYGEFDLSQETDYEPCLRAPGGCPCLRSGDCVERLRDFRGFPVYWLGESFEGLPLTSVDLFDYGQGDEGYVRGLSMNYGSCIIQAGQEGCGIPLTIHISRYCESPVAVADIAEESERFELRGAEAYAEVSLARSPSVFLRTGNVAIDIQGAGAAYVAGNLVRANGGKPSSPGEPFDPPVDECYPQSPPPAPTQ